jgi:hypothetical protein
MDYDDFELQLGPPVTGGYLVRVLQSPAGQGEAVIRLPEEERRAARDLRLRTGSEIPSTETGGQLFGSLFTGPIRELFLQSLSLAGPQRGLRIRLRINPRGDGLESLHRQPWELLYREATDDFLALSRRTPIVRALDLARPVPTYPFDPPLRILAVASQGPKEDLLNLGEELRQLRDALSHSAGTVLEVLENPGARTLRDVLESASFHALHYMGHGSFDPVTGEGGLLLRGPDGKREHLSGRHLTTKIKDVSSLRLVVLNACETAVVSGSPDHNPFAGVAAALLLGGVPAVVAMQSSIADHHAIAFSTAFYQQVARGMPIDEAVVEGRQAIHSLNPGGSDWSIPVLFLRTPTGELFARRSAKRRFSVATIVKAVAAALVVVLLASAPALLNPVKPKVHEPPPDPTPASQPLKVIQPREEERPPSAKAFEGAVRTVQVGEGSAGLRVQITGARSLPAAFDSALRRQLLKSDPANLAGWTLQLDTEASQINPFTEVGEVMQSCRLSVSGRLEGHGHTFDLGQIGGSRAGFNPSAACDAAAADLADRVARQIITHF